MPSASAHSQNTVSTTSGVAPKFICEAVAAIGSDYFASEYSRLDPCNNRGNLRRIVAGGRSVHPIIIIAVKVIAITKYEVVDIGLFRIMINFFQYFDQNWIQPFCMKYSLLAPARL